MFSAIFFRFSRAGRLSLALGCILLLAVSVAQAQLTPKTLDWQGTTRTWFEHVPPSYDGSAAVPLVIALHGNYSRADDFAPISEWMPKADATGFITVFPNGGVVAGDNSWGWNAFVFDGSAPDDAGFLFALIQQVEATYHIDPSRIYMVGFSNGGGMTSTFAALHASTLAAIAPVSGGWWTSFGVPTNVVTPDAGLPAWVWRGANENFENGSLTLAEQDRQQVEYWIGGDQYNPAVQAINDPPYTTEIYIGGKAEVRYTSIAGADHAYQPGTTERIWNDFFSRYARGVSSGGKTPPPVVTAMPSPVSSPVVPPEGAPVLSIMAETPQAFERELVPGSFLVTRSGGSVLDDLTVAYEIKGKAEAGVDYKPLRGIVTIKAGDDSARIKVRPLKNPEHDGNKNVRVTLLPGSGYAVSAPSMAKVQIVDRAPK